MKKSSVAILVLLVFLGGAYSWQKIETVNGVRLVHSKKGGLWGKSPKVALIPVQTLGDLYAEDEKYAFHMPSDVALDAAGNIYVLDAGNHRIQKFDKNGKYLATIGRQGQGPGEFYLPASLEIDEKGNLYVSDPNQQRFIILTPEGREMKTIRLEENMGAEFVLLKSEHILMGTGSMFIWGGPRGADKAAPASYLLKVLDIDGKLVRELGVPSKVRNELLRSTLDRTFFTADAAGSVYLAFPAQNRIDKYAPDGKLLWKADRDLNYEMDVLDKGKVDQKGTSVSIMAPRVNTCSAGIAVDAKGRVWVVTLNRQLKKEEQVSTQVGVTMADGKRSMSYKVVGDQDIQTTDAYKIEIFGPDGVLLGEIPLKIFVDGIFIFGDRLFILDKLRGTKFYEFKIEE